MWMVLNFLSFPFSVWYVKLLRRNMTEGGYISTNMHIFGGVSLVVCVISTIKSFSSF